MKSLPEEEKKAERDRLCVHGAKRGDGVAEVEDEPNHEAAGATADKGSWRRRLRVPHEDHGRPEHL